MTQELLNSLRVFHTREKLGNLDNIISQFGSNNPEFERRAKELRAEVEQLIEEHRDDRLPKKVEQVEQLTSDVWWSNPRNVVGMFVHLKQEKSKMSDQATAVRLIEQGDGCQEREDVEQLRRLDRQLIALLPRDIQDEITKGGYATGTTIQH